MNKLFTTLSFVTYGQLNTFSQCTLLNSLVISPNIIARNLLIYGVVKSDFATLNSLSVGALDNFELGLTFPPSVKSSFLFFPSFSLIELRHIFNIAKSTSRFTNVVKSAVLSVRMK